MRELILQQKQVNLEGLDAQLRAALGERMLGLSLRAGVLIAHLSDAADTADQQRAHELAAAHKPDELTDAQRETANRLAVLASARAQQGPPLRADEVQALEPALRRLAQKLLWLEQEVIDLRG